MGPDDIASAVSQAGGTIAVHHRCRVARRRVRDHRDGADPDGNQRERRLRRADVDSCGGRQVREEWATEELEPTARFEPATLRLQGS